MVLWCKWLDIKKEKGGWGYSSGQVKLAICIWDENPLETGYKWKILCWGWSCDVRDRYDIGLWLDIKKCWYILNSIIFFLFFFFFFCAGNGRRVKFWKDRWWRDEPLHVSFPSLYILALSKDAWVEELQD